jgi:ribosomal protein S18 acetylase RimI-like enzyme
MTDVRELGPQDWTAKRDLRLAALLDSPEAFADTYDAAARRDEVQWRAWPGGAGLFGAWQGGAPVGLAGVGDHGAGVAYLFTMWVAPAARGTGVGAALVDAARAWALEAGFESIVLEVTTGNERAARFYTRYGFVESDDPVITEGGTSMRLPVRG